MPPTDSAGWYLNDPVKNYSVGKLELLAVVWGLEKCRSNLCGKVVHMHIDRQTLEPLIKPSVPNVIATHD